MAGTFDSLTDCAICFEPMENPKILPCHHSFCGKCVENLIQGDNIKCPMDNKVSNVSNIQNDFRFENFRERLQRGSRTAVNQQSSGVLCSTCDEIEAVYACETCSEFLCRMCFKGHKKLTKNHVVISFEEKQNAMSCHQNIEEKIANFEKHIIEKQCLNSEKVRI